MARRLVVALILLVSGLVAGMVITARMRAADEAFAQVPAQQTQTPVAAPAGRIAAAAVAALPDFSSVAERTVPAVANISSKQLIRRRNSPYASDPFFQFFFGDPGDVYGSRPSVANSLGSGVIISADGYILTNNHVVTGEQRNISLSDIELSVSLSDKREMPAQIVGVDPGTDLALIKVNGRGLPTMSWGDSSRLKVAEWVLAIGNPYALNQSVSLGIVSATGRHNVGLSQYEDFIQTDAAINPGNSGGALINARGELVGINTAIYSESGGYQGIGFAVPSNLARKVAGDLQKYHQVRRGSIGYVEIMPVTTEIAQELNAPSARGVLVRSLSRNSSAMRSGLQPGDIILDFNGKAIADGSELSREIQDAAIGSTATFGIVRNGRRMDLKIPITP
ncbi:MAG TPA: trypsin-like peptidase domain-containing protein [Vicinamibacterales bacterium]|jgi:Do/DeqQ family serine protease|nr:trypsin-like peptidase domain-containing protein [Vicinamibacterales bacterium]